ncbi:MAG: hypothetical protein ACRDWY_16625 [Actinomycetes bacterium]
MRKWHVPWRWIGLAGVVGVAATGAVVARDERRRRSYSPDEIRDRLHARHGEEVHHPDPDLPDGGGSGSPAA